MGVLIFRLFADDISEGMGKRRVGSTFQSLKHALSLLFMMHVT